MTRHGTTSTYWPSGLLAILQSARCIRGRTSFSQPLVLHLAIATAVGGKPVEFDQQKVRLSPHDAPTGRGAPGRGV